MFKTLKGKEIEDYIAVNIKNQNFYIPIEEILRFYEGKQRFTKVYKEVMRGQLPGSAIVTVPIKDKRNLEEITKQWTLQERMKSQICSIPEVEKELEEQDLDAEGSYSYARRFLEEDL